jgi:hypothetical protein
MDAAGLAITIFVEVYHVAVFIKDVEHTRRKHSTEVEEFQRQLDRETTFLEMLNEVYFQDEESFRSFQSLPDRMKNDIKGAYEDISKYQDVYRVEMLRHGIDLSTSPSPSLANLSLVADKTPTKFSKRDWLKERCKDFVSRTDLQWALFDKAKIVELLRTYKIQTQHLKDVLSLNLLLESTRSKLTGREVLRKLRMQEVAARQRRAAQDAPLGYGKLEADLEVSEVPNQDQTIALRTLKRTPLEDVEVLVEVRSYDEKQRQDSDAGDGMHLRPIEQVTWLLKTDRESSWEEEDSLFTLRCTGFLDQPPLGRSLLCYELPFGITGSPRTLHDIISSHGKADDKSQPSRTKPALGLRFSLAYRLCTTLLQVHLSKWVHKRIWSRGVVVFENELDLVPYLQGWGLARRTEDETQLAYEAQIEANFYHHSQRWGQPVVKHECVHDIYSLGVVLLEIGIWRTVSVEFRKMINKFEEFAKGGGDLNQPGLFDQKHKALLTLVNSRDLKCQMGARYAETARWCLEGAAAMTKQDDEHSTNVIRAFKMQVVTELGRYIDM